jgi:valyl-tRNA synthetase
VRAEYNIPPGELVDLVITRATPAASGALKAERLTVERLAKVSPFTFGEPDGTVGAGAVLGDGTTLFVAFGSAIDVEQECRRLGTERTRLGDRIAQQEARLANDQFTTRAPTEVVDRERRKLADWQGQHDALAEKLQHLGCG